MIWLLAGPPVLCRAGALVNCCEGRPAESAAAEESRSACCDEDSGCTDPHSPSHQLPRKCGMCVTICSGPTKPTEVSVSPIMADAALPYVFAGPDTSPGRRSVYDFGPIKLLHRLPYPLSDVPLRI